MKPALTADEWAQQSFTRGHPDNVHITRHAGGVVTVDLQHSGSPGFPSADTIHAVAALLLHGQPFGFTREDVEAVRLQAEITELNTRPDVNRGATAEDRAILSYRAERLEWLADRIEALLPQP